MPKHCCADDFFIPYNISYAEIRKYVFLSIVKLLQHTRSFRAYFAQFCHIFAAVFCNDYYVCVLSMNYDNESTCLLVVSTCR